MTTPLTILLNAYEDANAVSEAAAEPVEALKTKVANSEAIAEALFDQIIDPNGYDSQRLLGAELSEGIATAGQHLGNGISCAAGWIAVAAVVCTAIVKWGA